MKPYRTVKYASLKIDANFFAVVYNGREAAFEISGKDLGVKEGYKRIAKAEFFRMMENLKAKENADFTRTEKKLVKVANKKETSIYRTNLSGAIKEIARKVPKGSYKMARSEYAWNYLPTNY